MDDDDLPKRARRLLQPPVLDGLGVDELTAYVAELRQEIMRVEAETARKQSHRSAADSFFRS